jgi:hypothetical protein
VEPLTDEADVVAELAARAAGVRVRELTDLAEFGAACRLFEEIWRPSPANPPVTVDQAGWYVVRTKEESR